VIAIALVLAFSALFRADTESERQPFAWASSVRIPVVPPPVPAVDQITLASGLTVLVPNTGELCWTQFPLCSPNPSPDTRFIGSDLSDGLAGSTSP
jgi:hypothetical protein